MTSRERRKQAKRKKRVRRLAARKPPPECGWCGKSMTRRALDFLDPFSGWWTCEPCQTGLAGIETAAPEKGRLLRAYTRDELQRFKEAP